MKYLILFIIQIIGFSIVFSAQADVVQWSQGYTAGCDNPTDREDGTPMDVSEIDRIEYYIDPVDGNPDPLYTIEMSGGCQDMHVDTKQFSIGDYFRYGKTFDTGGLESTFSPGVAMTIQKARPKPPTGIK